MFLRTIQKEKKEDGVIEAVVVSLILLWFLGVVRIPWLHIPNFTLFHFNGHAISFFSILIFGLLVFLADLLPSPFRQIAAVLLVLYALSTLGLIAIAGFANIIVIASIVSVLLYLFGRK